MARYLVVANQTLGGDELVGKLEELSAEEPSELVLLVPVTDTEGRHQWDYPPIDRVIPEAHEIASALAAGRLEHELARLRRAGVTADGEVGPIGGIRQKLFGAKDAGADWFLAPEANCDEVVGHIPDGLQVFSVETLDDALEALEVVRDGGDLDALPTCTAG